MSFYQNIKWWVKTWVNFPLPWILWIQLLTIIQKINGEEATLVTDSQCPILHLKACRTECSPCRGDGHAGGRGEPRSTSHLSRRQSDWSPWHHLMSPLAAWTQHTWHPSDRKTDSQPASSNNDCLLFFQSCLMMSDDETVAIGLNWCRHCKWLDLIIVFVRFNLKFLLCIFWWK